MHETREPITSKPQMYKLLATGLLGNTINQYFSVEEWQSSEEYHKFDIWGVRSMTPGGPCRLYCPKDEVVETAESFKPHQINISIMIDAVARVVLMADIFMGDYGLELYGIENPTKGANWRRDMPSMGRTYRFTAARGVIARCLTPADREDLNELLDLYPGHVIELSAIDRCLGIYPHRKGIIWEVRCDTGAYEEATWGRKTMMPQGSSQTGD